MTGRGRPVRGPSAGRRSGLETLRSRAIAVTNLDRGSPSRRISRNRVRPGQKFGHHRADQPPRLTGTRPPARRVQGRLVPTPVLGYMVARSGAHTASTATRCRRPNFCIKLEKSSFGAELRRIDGRSTTPTTRSARRRARPDGLCELPSSERTPFPICAARVKRTRASARPLGSPAVTCAFLQRILILASWLIYRKHVLNLSGGGPHGPVRSAMSVEGSVCHVSLLRRNLGNEKGGSGTTCC